MIFCRGLAKTYGEFRAVAGVSFDVKGGAVCALLGPNGAGKSTLVKMLTGLLQATGGSATVCGLTVGDPALKRIVGILPESLALFDALTVGEHLELTGAVYGLSKVDTRTRTAQLLRVLRLEHGRDTFIHQCSYGMKKKTSLAMALLPNPQALFLDEPFEGLDPITAETIRVQLRAIAARGVTVLLTSHILSMVDRVADQVVMIHRGGVVLDSAIADLPKGLEEMYFERVERTAAEDLEWLGVRAS
ncbi:MAG: ABC transporter ATP-binding protein [Acidobacteriota bacterium]